VDFAERYGYVMPRLEVQVEDLDEPTRTALWTGIHLFFCQVLEVNADHRSATAREHHPFIVRLFLHRFHVPYDRIPLDNVHSVNEKIRSEYFSGPWFQSLALLEHIAKQWDDDQEAKDFRDFTNRLFEEYLVGCRFVGKDLLRLTSPEQVAAVEEAQAAANAVPPAQAHLDKAISLLNSGETSNYGNAIKESISAVEAVARHVTGKSGATLADALKAVPDLHPALKDGWLKLYGFTSDAKGIRHAARDGDVEASQDLALYMLVTCSAMVSYLLAQVPKTS
jgi:hypothetical protein